VSDEQAERAEREQKLRQCEQAIGHRFRDRSLLELALTHSSLRDPWTESNERLEFLGDSVIGLSVSEHLFCAFPEHAEGELTRIKSIVVSRPSLAKLGKQLDLKQFLRVGKGIRKRRTIPPSLIANTVEALVGAVYLDAGYESARSLILGLLEDQLLRVTKRRDVRNYKATLQQSVQKRFGVTPRYRVLEAVGPDHKKEFVVEALIDGTAYAPARGSTKKQAEQRAAREALRALRQEHGSDLA